MFKSNKFGRIFWVDDELEFKSCPLNVDETGDFECEDYVSEWTDWEGVDMNELLAIHKVCILNKTQYAGSLVLNDKAHKIIDSQELEGDISTYTDDDYADKVDTFTEKKEVKIDYNLYNYAMQHYTWDETFYNEIVKDSEFSYGKFNETNYPIHLHRHLQQH